MPEQSGYLGIRTPIFGQQQMESSIAPTKTPFDAAEMQAPPQDTRLLDQYHDVLSKKPERPKPRLLNKIGATLSAIAGDMEGVERNLYGNYHRNMQDWETELGILEKGVGIEGKANIEAMRQSMNEFNQQMQRERLDLERQKVAITDLNAQTRIADVERKYNEAVAKLQLAYDQLAARQGDAAAMRELRQAELDATNARHALQMSLAEARLAEQARVNDARINQINERLADDGLRVVTNSDGTWTVTRIERRGAEARDAITEIPMINRETGRRKVVTQEDINRGEVGENWMTFEDYERWRVRPQPGDIQLPPGGR